MTRLVFNEDRLPDLTFGRHSNHVDSGPVGYRFGRISGTRVRISAGRVARGARSLFNAMLELIAAAKDRRIERELKIGGRRYDHVRLDDNRFTGDAD